MKYNDFENKLKSKIKKQSPLHNLREADVRQPNMRDMLGIMRKLNEDDTSVKNTVVVDANDDVEDNTKKLGDDRKTFLDQGLEEKKIINYFKDLNVDIVFDKLDVFENGVFWGATLDNQIQFVYMATHEELTSGVEINTTDDFDPNVEENKLIVKKIEDYYNVFYKYWRDNVLQK